MKELVAHIAESLVDQPDQVHVGQTENDDTFAVELSVAQ